MKPNPVVWFEIYVQDVERARRFYETVFQCTLEPLAPPDGQAQGTMQMLAFPMVMSESGAPGAGGALVKMDGVGSGAGGTIVYFACEDCSVEQGRVQPAGGQVSKPKFSIGQYGFAALVADTEGNMIGLHSMR